MRQMTRSLLHLAAWFPGVAVLVAMLIAAAFVAVINWIFAVAELGDREGNEE